MQAPSTLKVSFNDRCNHYAIILLQVKNYASARSPSLIF